MEAGALVKVVHSLGKLCIFISIDFILFILNTTTCTRKTKTLTSYLSNAVEMSPFKINVSFIFLFFIFKSIYFFFFLTICIIHLTKVLKKVH